MMVTYDKQLILLIILLTIAHILQVYQSFITTPSLQIPRTQEPAQIDRMTVLPYRAVYYWRILLFCSLISKADNAATIHKKTVDSFIC